MKCTRRPRYLKSAWGARMPVLKGITLIAIPVAVMAFWPQAPRGFSATQWLPRAIERNAYENWVEGPVSYIIRPRERTAFEKLTTDEERDMFIQQFWERRNPTPGSKTNPFKKEFYRRVKFASAHFSFFLPGWMSDRGHMYILYGPPDEIHFLPHATPHPYADWLYAYIPGLGAHLTFRFIVRAGNDQYRLAYQPWK